MGSIRMALKGTSGKPTPRFVQVPPLFPETYTCDVPYPPNTTNTLSSLVGLMAKSITNLLGKLLFILLNGTAPVMLSSTLGEPVMYKLFPLLSYCAKGEVETYTLLGSVGDTANATAVL